MNQMHVRFGAEDDDLWGALKALPPGARSREVREALRLVFLGPGVLRELAEALSRLPASPIGGIPAEPENGPVIPPVLREPSDAGLDDFLASLQG